MSKRIRVIPILSIIEGQLVKTKRFKNPNYLGDPINAIKIFNDKEVDEIVVIDIRASLHNQAPDYSLIKEMAGECFMPLAYGGNINSFQIAKKIFDLGVEKVVLNTNIQNNFKLTLDIASTYGDQSVVASIDIGNSLFRKRVMKFKSGSISCRENILHFCKELVNNGVGEILLNNIERDGMFSGYDIELISEIANNISVPVIAYGGASNMEDFVNATLNGGASAVAASSMFVYKNNNTESILINYPSQEELKGKFYKHIQ